MYYLDITERAQAVIICQTLSGLMEMIYMMLYEEDSKGLVDSRGYIQDGPRAVT